MTTAVTVWSDIHCPWATVAIHRLRRARDATGLDVVFDQRAWPLEWVNGQGLPHDIVVPETIVLAAHEPELFAYRRGARWPPTLLPAFELVAAARRVHGLRAAEDVDYHLRRRFFGEWADLSLRHELRATLDRVAAETPVTGFDPDAVLRAWSTEPVRADVDADFRRSGELPIQGSPQIFWPDGSTSHNPGMQDHEWDRGIPRIGSSDADAPARLLRERAGG